MAEAGIHSGEAETSISLMLQPESVRLEMLEVGYVGDLSTGIQRFQTVGAHAVSENGVFGDPRRATSSAGRAYFDRLVESFVQLAEEAWGTNRPH